MTWILLSLLAPLFWAGSNIFDKYALDKLSKGKYDFLFFGTIGSFIIVLIVLAVFGIEHFGLLSIIPLVAGFFIQYSYVFYSSALEKEDASRIVPLYATYSVVVLIFGPLFGEVLSSKQLIFFLIVFLGVMTLSLKELSLNIFRYRKGAIEMIPAILLLSFYVLIIDFSLENMSFVDVFIYDLVGFSLAGISLMLIPKWRREIILGIKTASLRKYKLFLINDTMDMSGHLIYKLALLLAPSASLVAVLGGIQAFYVLILGILLTLYFPSIVKENVTRAELIQKTLGAIIIFSGIALLNLSL